MSTQHITQLNTRCTMLPPHVRTQIYYREDIRAMLESVEQVSDGILKHIPGPDAAAYQAGFRAAVNAIATALGVPHV